MNRNLVRALVAAAAFGLAGMAGAQTVRIATSEGDVLIKLDAEKAPKTVANFLAYVKTGQYAGTIFHRVMPGFMIQGGGYTANLSEKPTRPPIPLESANGLKNRRGTIAMARTAAPDSATAQFFINLKDNGFLDANGSPRPNGYAVFGQVIQGMDVVDKIAAVRTEALGPHEAVPVTPVTIKQVTVEK
ncbi:MAG: peptidyl-prolyl cis-trans isomerase [Aquabacterium sp.]|jgi:peptidyl-prolyl cis-trans isomerase A (cyclophilin A)|nr:MAG: peptidyl-prolyl cis-trans isomerase [Aquabacterium sp.]